MARLQIVGLKVEVQGLGSQAGAQKTREMKVKERNGEKSKIPTLTKPRMGHLAEG